MATIQSHVPVVLLRMEMVLSTCTVRHVSMLGRVTRLPLILVSFLLPDLNDNTSLVVHLLVLHIIGDAVWNNDGLLDCYGHLGVDG